MKKKSSHQRSLTHNYRNRSKHYTTASIAALGIFLMFALAVSALAEAAQKSKKPQPAQFEAKVVGVTDGDTMTVLTRHNEQIKIRIYGIDAPEKKQAFGSKSKEFLSSLVFDRNVTIEPKSRDLYGRTIARVYCDDRDVGLTSIEFGFSWWYKEYAKTETDYKKAQAKAKRQKLGLWQDLSPVEPWNFRKKKGAVRNQDSLPEMARSIW